MRYFYRNRRNLHPSAAPASFPPTLFSQPVFFFFNFINLFFIFFMQRRLKSQKSHLHPAALGSLCSHAAAPACFSEDDHRCYLSRRSSAFCVFLIRIPHFIPRKTTGVTCRREGGTSKAPGAGPGWASLGRRTPSPTQAAVIGKKAPPCDQQ